MINSSQIAQQLVNLYGGPKGFDIYEPGNGDNGICYGIIKSPTENQIFLRGSAKLQDWVRDLMAITNPFEHDVFGPIHPGAFIGLEAASVQISKHLDSTKPILISGHSLGGQRTTLLTALFIQMGILPKNMRRVPFAAPKAGFRKLLDYVAGVPVQSYWNSVNVFHDPVPMLPATFPPEDYVQDPLIMVSGNPDAKIWLELGIFAPHHMPAYLVGVSKLPA